MRFNDAVIGLTLIIFGIAVLVHTRGFPSLEEGYPGPSLFPNVLALLFIITGIILSFKGVRRGKPIVTIDSRLIRSRAPVNILSVLAVVLFYIFLSDILGFLILSFVLLFLMMKWLKGTPLWSLVMACGVTLVIYLLFAKVLLVPLPWGLLGW